MAKSRVTSRTKPKAPARAKRTSTASKGKGVTPARSTSKTSKTATPARTSKSRPKAAASPPSSDGRNGGRNPDGTFAKGNRLGHGSPLAQKASTLRAALLNSVSERDIQQVAKTLLTEAKGGDIHASRLLLAYLLGPPQPADLIERLEFLEREVVHDEDA